MQDAQYSIVEFTNQIATNLYPNERPCCKACRGVKRGPQTAKKGKPRVPHARRVHVRLGVREYDRRRDGRRFYKPLSEEASTTKPADVDVETEETPRPTEEEPDPSTPREFIVRPGTERVRRRQSWVEGTGTETSSL
ncbi:hypothetical protein ACROYT_G036803 [Oculina patagonica]